MNDLFFGSICLTDLIEHAKQKHSAFTKGNNGKIYASVNVWLNDKEDKFGNIMSIQINPSKEMKDIDKRVYIGNLKKSDGPAPLSDRDTSGLDTDLDVPSRPPKTNYADQYSAANWDKKDDKPNPAADITEPISDLPF